MTIAAVISQVRYVATGSATTFAFSNKIFSATDLVVTIYDPSGNAYQFTNFGNIVLGLTYTVNNVDVDTGCSVQFSAPPTAGWSVDIRSVTPETQSTSIRNQSSFLPELHEEAFDRLTRELQDVFRLTYTYGLHAADTETVPWNALPSPTARANKALLFDSNGQPYAGAGSSSTGLAAGLASSAIIGIAPSGDAQGNLVQIAGGTDISSGQGSLIRIGTFSAPLVNNGVNSAQFAIGINVDGTNAPGKSIQCLILRNTSADPSCINYALEAGNDQVGQELIIGTTSSTFTLPNFFVGAPSSQFKFINTITNVPLIIGAGGVATMILTNNKITCYGPTAAAQVDMTADASSFTGVMATGFTTTPNITINWSRQGNSVTLTFNTTTATGGGGSGTAFTITGLPSFLQPTRNQRLPLAYGAIEDNSVVGVNADVLVQSGSNQLTFFKNGSVSGWTAAGTKGIAANCSITYTLA